MNTSSPCLAVQLPFCFEPDALARDLSSCTGVEWQPHFNQADYSGTWNSIALYSPDGEAENIKTFGGVFRPTPLLTACPCFSLILDTLACEKESVRLLNLAPGSTIREHRDRGLAYEYGSFRIHVPIHTNERVEFFVGGKRLDMKAGECWYANFDQPHSVVNASSRSRVHLVIDCIRNEWTDRIFAEAGFDFAQEKENSAPDRRTIIGMIAELERMDTPASKNIIDELKRKLNAGTGAA